jgi:hypothetical protein
MKPTDGILVASYLKSALSDDEYFPTTYPQKGEKLIYNVEYLGDHSEIYITHEVDGHITKRVNMNALDEISFKETP